MTLFEERVQKVRELASTHKLDGLFIASEPNMRYFTGYSTLSIERLVGVLISMDAEPVLLVPELEKEKAARFSVFKSIRTYADGEDPATIVENVANGLKLTKGRVGIEDSLPFKFCKMLTRAGPSLQLVEASDLIQKLRSIKSAEEIALMKKSASIVAAGIGAGIETVKAGVSELAVAFEIEKKMKGSGCESVPFCIVLSGENSAFPHGSTSNRRIRKGDAVVMDVGATFKGYYADLTRTVFVGQASEKQKSVYETVLAALEKAVKCVKPNVKACEVDDAARKTIGKAGYGKFFTHRTGHGLGLEVHEEPYIAQRNETILKAGMTFTVEPGIYLPRKFGVRIEDDVAVSTAKAQLISHFSREILVR